MAFNLELAERALKNIETFPETWDQTDWRCGTTYCFAGHVAMLAGATWVNDSRPDDVTTPDGREMLVDEYALEALGIQKYDEHPWPKTAHSRAYMSLFFCPTDFVELKRRVAAVAKELGT